MPQVLAIWKFSDAISKKAQTLVYGISVPYFQTPKNTSEPPNGSKLYGWELSVFGDFPARGMELMAPEVKTSCKFQ